jgi:hypothetical protein
MVLEGQRMYVDLVAAEHGHGMALVHDMLGPRLDAETRERIRTETKRRVIAPTMKHIRNPTRLPLARHHWWSQSTGNWNVVCTAGTTGAVLGLCPSKEKRARAVLAAEENTRRYLSGFTDRGYTSEGLSYWNYGFSRFLLLGELLADQTKPALDLLGRSRAIEAARLPMHLEIAEGVYPAFADTHGITPSPSRNTLTYAKRRILGIDTGAWQPARHLGGGLPQMMLHTRVPRVREGGPGGADPGLRSFFPEAGVLVGRGPRARRAETLGLALKSGSTAEHHNHHDVGTYGVARGGVPLLVDPGATKYTAATFDHRRYENPILNAFGHAVPVVAGAGQRGGASAAGKIVERRFGSEADVLKADLSSCYRVQPLRTLTRRYRYERAGEGALTITDRVVFSKPRGFATTLVGRKDWRRLAPNRLAVQAKGQAVAVEIEASSEYHVRAHRIPNPNRFSPGRIELRMAEPVKEGRFRLRISPIPAEKLQGADRIELAEWEGRGRR